MPMDGRYPDVAGSKQKGMPMDGLYPKIAGAIF